MSEAAVPTPAGANVADTPAATAATAQSQGGGTPRDDDGAAAKRRRRGKSKPAALAEPITYRLGERVKASAETPRYERKIDDPVYRPLKIYTIDPSRHRDQGQTAEINIPYEEVAAGPTGYRFEVRKSPSVPFSKYRDVNLNEPRLLINNGHDPAPTDPVFHHQMVYAVAMSTYAVFRTALGREIGWGFAGERLILVPHAFEDANACYRPDQGTLEFGWYKVEAAEKIDLPDGAHVFSCLSHDIIVHELTHALLDGLRVRFDRSTNPDVGAFHEAFADLVALLLRFSYRQVVQDIILSTHGDLTRDGDWLRFVFELAQGKGERSLRQIDLQAKQKYVPDAPEYELGTILVSAIIDAFVTIYTKKAAPLIRMASGGRKTLPDSQSMPADLLIALTHIASRLASQLLNMCIRAIDYCPAVDMTLGEYLRALITADRDLIPDDVWSYREALVEAFRKRRIFPDRVKALTEDALLWEQPMKPIVVPGLNFGELRFSGDPGRAASSEEVFRQASLIGELVCQRDLLDIFGLADPKDPLFEGEVVEGPVIESVRSSRRVGPDGQLSFGLIAEVIQRRYVPGGEGYPDFIFRGGSTIVFGSQGEVRYIIAKSVKNAERLQRQRDFEMRSGADVYALQSCRYQARPAVPAAPLTRMPARAKRETAKPQARSRKRRVKPDRARR